MTNLTLIIEKNNDEYWGQIQEYPDVFSHGSNLTDLMNNAQVALNLYLDTIGETSIDNPQFQLVVDLQEFFIINDFINITKLAKRTGMNTSLLRQYAKGIKFPSIEQVSRIERTIKEIGAELLKTHLLNKTIETN